MESPLPLPPWKTLLALLAATGISQTAIAQHLTVSRKLVHAWYSGHRRLKLSYYHPLLVLVTKTIPQRLQTLFPPGAPLTREDVHTGSVRYHTFRQIYNALIALLEEWAQYRTTIDETLTAACQVTCEGAHLPAQEWDVPTRARIHEAAATLVAYSAVRDALGDMQWERWLAACEATIATLKEWENESYAETNF